MAACGSISIVLPPCPEEAALYFHGRADETCAFAASGCFCFVGDRLLLIRRQTGKPLAHHWGVPTGKLEPGETPRQAVIRELHEEVGLAIPPDATHEVVTAIVEDAGTRFAYTSFVLTLPEQPVLRPNATEIAAVDWAAPADLHGRAFVPFFFNTLADVGQWQRQGAVEPDPKPRAELTF